MIVARDADSGENGQLVFRMVSVGAVTSPFYIENTTGIIRVAGPLDRETESRYVVSLSTYFWCCSLVFFWSGRVYILWATHSGPG